MATRKPQHQLWYEQVKRELLMTEPQNILARSECCQSIVNDVMQSMCSALSLPPLKQPEMYRCLVKPKDHLQFLLKWPGLRCDNSPKAPKSKKEYEKKSKNWLNGRRAPNYGKTLFPFFIHDAEQYIGDTAKLLIPYDIDRQRFFYDIVIYKVLAQLCGCSVSLHEQAKKAPFFCKNSVERKGRLKEIFQSYATDHPYVQGFPSCFDEAIGFFDKKSNQFGRDYKIRYLGQAPSGDSQTSVSSVSVVNSRGHEYWKREFMRLKRELLAEKEKRVLIEQERDRLKQMLRSDRLSLKNECSMDSSSSSQMSMNTMTNTTASVPTHQQMQMPMQMSMQMQMPMAPVVNNNFPSSAFTGQQSSMTFSSEQRSNCQKQCQQCHTNSHSQQSQYFVNKCSNNSYCNSDNFNALPSLNSSFVIPHNVNVNMQAQRTSAAQPQCIPFPPTAFDKSSVVTMQPPMLFQNSNDNTYYGATPTEVVDFNNDHFTHNLAGPTSPMPMF